MIHTLKDYKDNEEMKMKPNIKKSNKYRSLGKIPKNATKPISKNPNAFKGKGRAVSQVNVSGLKVDKYVQNKPDKNKPIYNIRIRLFNGQIIQCNFNSNQTVRDIKNFIQKKSGSLNFSIMEGFPPKALTQLNKTIEELNLKDCLLTQRINK